MLDYKKPNQLLSEYYPYNPIKDPILWRSKYVYIVSVYFEARELHRKAFDVGVRYRKQLQKLQHETTN